MVARQNPSGELHEISTAWVKEYADGTIDSKASRLNFDVDDEELHGGLIKEYPMFSLEGVESRVKDGMDDMWYVGAMSDCIYIINKPARPGNDDIWHHRPDGPSMSICLPNLNAKQAQLICDLHNNKILKGLSSDELIQSLRQQLADTQRKPEAAEKDAERYRYLKDVDVFILDQYDEREWDEAIDRAIEQGKGGGV